MTFQNNEIQKKSSFYVDYRYRTGKTSSILLNTREIYKLKLIVKNKI